MLTPITLKRFRHPNGATSNAFSFDFVQFMLWSLQARAPILQMERMGGGGFNWQIDVNPQVAKKLVADLTDVRTQGYVGEWRIGSWPRQVRFTFRGPYKANADYVLVTLVHVTAFPVSSVRMKVRKSSIELLQDALSRHAA